MMRKIAWSFGMLSLLCAFGADVLAQAVARPPAAATQTPPQRSVPAKKAVSVGQKQRATVAKTPAKRAPASGKAVSDGRAAAAAAQTGASATKTKAETGTVQSASGQAPAAATKTKAVAGSAPSASDSVRVIAPNGGEEIVAGTDLDIQWHSENKGGTVAITLMVENQIGGANASTFAGLGLIAPAGSTAINFPAVLTTNAPDTGSFKYRVPYALNSRFGYQFKVIVQKGAQKDESDSPFSIYPKVDLAPVNIQIRNKKKSAWGLVALTSILTGGAASLPGGAEAALMKEAVDYAKKDNKAISHKKDIEIEFDVMSHGVDILTQPLMTKVAVRLHPGGAELNAAGFSHAKIVPGRKYHYKAAINPKQWDIAPGTYRLEIWVDPQNNAHEPEPLRANNKKTVRFQVN